MSRLIDMAHTYKTRFPRVSGDEPPYRGNDATKAVFSPRERG